MNTAQEKVKIMGASAIKAKLRRIAYEIYERNYAQESLVLVGIGKRGAYLAGQVQLVLKEISPIRVELLRASKVGDAREVQLHEDPAIPLQGQHVIVVDDVLYSGATMFKVMAAVLDHDPAKIQSMVLIDRGHRNLPVTHDYVGMVLATSLKQYVSVEVQPQEDKAIAYLF